MCDVCCDDCNNCVKCNHCNYKTCNECYVKYFLMIEDINKHCMNCKGSHNFDFIKKFLPEDIIKNNFQEIAFKEQEILFPFDQKEASIVRKINNTHIKIRDISKKKKLLIKQASKKIQLLNEDNKKNSPYDLSINIKRELIKKNYTHKNIKKQIDLKELNKELALLIKERVEISNKNNITITFKCSEPLCNGFVANDYCLTCNKRFCTECREKYTEKHRCSKENIENTKFIKENTKNCPRCWTIILKTEGCNHMYCTECNTAFHWKTGHIIKGAIQNPEYYENLRKQGKPIPRNPNDIVCLLNSDQYRKVFSDLLKDDLDFQCISICIFDLLNAFEFISNLIYRRNSNYNSYNYMKSIIIKNVRIGLINKTQTITYARYEFFKYKVLELFEEDLSNVLYTFRETLNGLLFKSICISYDRLKNKDDNFCNYKQLVLTHVKNIALNLISEYNNNITELKTKYIVSIDTTHYLIIPIV